MVSGQSISLSCWFRGLAQLAIGAIALLMFSGTAMAQEQNLDNACSTTEEAKADESKEPLETDPTLQTPQEENLAGDCSPPEEAKVENSIVPLQRDDNKESTRQVAQSRDPMVLHDANGLTIRSHLQFGINAVAETNLFWNFADFVAPTSGFDSDTQWLEFYVKPGVSIEKKFDTSAVYGKLSAVGSYTLGTDAYDASDTGRITLEEAYAGYRTISTNGINFDVSLGPRELKLGTGMLIANGGSSGFERGALKFGPRKAWEMAAIASLSSGDMKSTLFYIDPNEMPSNNSGNKLAGIDVRFDNSSGEYIGLTYLNVLESRAPYPQAAPGGIGAPTVIPGARDGLNAVNLYARTNPFKGGLEKLFLAGDFAYEWNNRINMEAWGGRVQVGYTFDKLPWKPTLIYSYQTFSGDNPNTSKLERFDPLFYEGSPSAWATGSKSSMVFINSNVQSHGIALRLSPTRQDTVTFRYAHIRANELGSPIQFGQATRLDFSNDVPTVISGVDSSVVSNDFFLEYSRIINRNTFLTAGLSVSVPGKGITSAFPGDVPVWTGGFVNVVFNF